MNHKRGRTRNRRAGCKMCKHWKVNGFATERLEGETYSAHRSRYFAGREIRDYAGRARRENAAQ